MSRRVLKILINQDTYLHTSAKSGQSFVFEKLIIEEEIKNPKNNKGQTLFHIICERGHIRLAEILLQNHIEFDANEKWYGCEAPIILACQKNRLKMVEMLIEKSDEFKIDLNVHNILEGTTFLWACKKGHLKIVNMIIEKSTEVNIQFDSKDIGK